MGESRPLGNHLAQLRPVLVEGMRTERGLLHRVAGLEELCHACSSGAREADVRENGPVRRGADLVVGLLDDESGVLQHPVHAGVKLLQPDGVLPVLKVKLRLAESEIDRDGVLELLRVHTERKKDTPRQEDASQNAVRTHIQLLIQNNSIILSLSAPKPASGTAHNTHNPPDPPRTTSQIYRFSPKTATSRRINCKKILTNFSRLPVRVFSPPRNLHIVRTRPLFPDKS